MSWRKVTFSTWRHLRSDTCDIVTFAQLTSIYIENARQVFSFHLKIRFWTLVSLSIFSWFYIPARKGVSKKRMSGQNWSNRLIWRKCTCRWRAYTFTVLRQIPAVNWFVFKTYCCFEKLLQWFFMETLRCCEHRDQTLENLKFEKLIHPSTHCLCFVSF